MATPNSTTTTSARSNSNPDFIFPKGRGFKMAILNITCLLKHIDELRIALDGQPIDILAINETRLDGSISDQDVKIVGYDVIRRDRTVNGRFEKVIDWPQHCKFLCPRSEDMISSLFPLQKYACFAG